MSVTTAEGEERVAASIRSKRKEVFLNEKPMYDKPFTTEVAAWKQFTLKEPHDLGSKTSCRALGETCAQAMLQGQRFRQYLREHSVHPSSSEMPWWSEPRRQPLAEQLNSGSKKKPSTAGPKVRVHGDLSWPMQNFQKRKRVPADQFPLPCTMYRLDPKSDWYSVDNLRQAMKTNVEGDFPSPYLMFRDYAVPRR